MFWTPANFFVKLPFMPEAGLMSHPGRANKLALGSDDGKWIFESKFTALEKNPASTSS